MPTPFPTLSHREWAQLARLLRLELLAEGAPVWRFHRVRVPARPRFPEGFLKNEWVIELRSRDAVSALTVSLRPKRPYVFLGESPPAARAGTRKGFDLQLEKLLEGAKLVELAALEEDRILRLGFEGSDGRLELFFVLFPALPEAVVLRGSDGATLLRSRAEAQAWTAPSPQAPQQVPYREEWVNSLKAWRNLVEGALHQEAFELRLARARKAFEEALALVTTRTGQSREAALDSGRGTDWARLGNALKSALQTGSKLERNGEKLHLFDEAAPEGFWAAAPSSMSPGQLLEHYFSQAKRHRRKREESQARVDAFTQKLKALQPLRAQLMRLASVEEPTDEAWVKLEALERALGLEALKEPSVKAASKKAAWLGKRFISQEGLTLLAGRSRDENLELTFKIARGNDLWLHLKGRPGAHVVVQLPAGRSASLETLLDACQLVLHYSKAASGGKVEVDYTHRKHVKRIRDSKEVSYTHNKTLIVASDPERLDRLLAQ